MDDLQSLLEDSNEMYSVISSGHEISNVVDDDALEEGIFIFVPLELQSLQKSQHISTATTYLDSLGARKSEAVSGFENSIARP
ncbi:hypothetical protein DI09_67p140 [Mitosporidium daphniae]|uniref:Uncharacterized protein n=1 Tax=Mitosporidium daphniae TaxID=1485682 RepID=A0A098VS18_9MICR|nr:uncharacterized protein DI09_67p140 [Mitosporidium daphniae]KGG50526.1 hypothetical protein DI09_67p140 [Mitosporidium daphniae]|eukprot:XP_013236953.1 uncharacterized protein DI09_67p140 [Mitosporidium daphniae]